MFAKNSITISFFPPFLLLILLLVEIFFHPRSPSKRTLALERLGPQEVFFPKRHAPRFDAVFPVTQSLQTKKLFFIWGLFLL